MAERTPERLVRLLGLVAYLDRHPGAPVEQVAEQFGVSPVQVLKDVDTLWMSGTPGYFPDDLIDFDADSLDSGVLRLTQSRGMARALRLGTREAVALVAALRALDASVGEALEPAERRLLASTLEALTAATGEAAATVDVRLSLEADPEVLATVRAALRDGRRLHLRYVDAADRTTEREVDPWQVVTGDERSYLSAWCHTSGGERLFRLDRILAAGVQDEAVTTTPAPVATTYRPASQHPRVRLSLEGRARWAAEQLPTERVVDDPDGFTMDLRVATSAWLRALVLRLAPFVRDVQPDEVARDAGRAAARALAVYRSLGLVRDDA
ncbi:WYL domain-containing protein [Isoptericola sp. b441]|uniref:WYL domain-containing protein n=1 Tax=Actinotalea lenta TaxID=3064654 RepID=A0ABT9DC52_9CELL|nr:MULTISPECIES: WYL domain-containing protein [unclassified Isoptericola]MDO8107753.1 WYL domain-containing protein [Isoptericola sp. b441]MDO8120576.1 WYL domain-containing protein [Isoptericola sp. b490]